MAMTYFPDRREPHGQRRAVTWRALCTWLSTPCVSPVKEVGGFSVATFAEDHRKTENVQEVYAIGLDLDECPSLEDLRSKFTACDAFVHTTWSSTLDALRARVFLRLSRPVTADEYRRCYRAAVVVAEKAGLTVDTAASDPSRFWYRPSIAEVGRSFIYWANEGKPFDVERALEVIPAAPVAEARPALPGDAGVFDRARNYALRVPGAVSGSGGSTATFALANKLVRGFALSCDDALAIMLEWNKACSPPWSEAELVRKVDQAWKAGAHQVGDMLERTAR